jgi:YesN/AraC family two-component response regulator
MAIKVMIVDDQHLFAEGLKYVLLGEGKGRIEIVGMAEDGRQAVEAVRSAGLGWAGRTIFPRHRFT